MQATPARTPASDVPRCLELLREADRLLDSAPRTARSELAAAASDRAPAAALGGAVGGALLAAAAGGARGSQTPAAARELDEACRVLRQAAEALGEHPSAGLITQMVNRLQAHAIESASATLGSMVRQIHGDLRAQFGLMDTPPLTNWAVNDPEDEAALRAAGLGVGSKAWKIAIAVCVFVGVYALVLSR